MSGITKRQILSKLETKLLGNDKVQYSEKKKKSITEKMMKFAPSKYTEWTQGKGEAGIIIGKHPTKNTLLKSYGQTFAYLAAEPGGGKGVGAVIPNLLDYPDSVVCCDPKMENWMITAGWRELMGHKCFCFQPESFSSHRYNPLDYVNRDQDFRVGDIKAFASILYDPREDHKNANWYGKAGDAFGGIVLYMLESENCPAERFRCPVTLAQAYEFASAAEGVDKWIHRIVEEREDAGVPLSGECVRELKNFASSASNPSGWASTTGILKDRLSLFAEKTVAAATSSSDFDFRQLRREKISIYFCVGQNSLEKYSILMNLFFSQAILENTKVLPEHDSTLKHQCLMLMDEFAVMGPINIMKTAPALTRAYNVRYLIIFQNKDQLRDGKLYGEAGTKAILQAFHIEIVFTMQDEVAAKEYSEKLGYQTLKQAKTSRTTATGQGGGSRNRSVEEYERALMLPQEIMEMPYDYQLLFISPTRKTEPLKVKSRKVFWYEERNLAICGDLTPPEIRYTNPLDLPSLTVRP
ncbi:TPA: type IV secretory system conjugative DNA transfer family protein [Klebsiella pneumoniae]|uniref:Type IV secretory system conjugative DNA transfer family protein n=2 Tax=Klebsiella pneumoniae TaxID=573 RepID=A0A3G4RJD2_KLEPN|nr:MULTISPECIES: type IV secretory system conjugative DNA transfer family protein [Klebsiella]AYU65775.1 hypothetical protein [Klebsiella pneumoniae]MCC4959760.1 type IV secretory system conjugative DNA transfer family protein [Klebsiella pneumoniae]MCD7089495.1 type IV secretory system conjugative DNA transfer family protein [Klebsiella quasipneumoniae subsp. quasipneumoniae]OUY91557.1 hypothetical protein BLL04_19745 [Klebsiella variicola]QIM13771.1 Coupling protein VirD4, ATPase required fo